GRLSHPGALDGADVTIHHAPRSALSPRAPAFRSRAMAAASRGDASEVFLFPVRRRDTYLHRGAVRVDGGDSYPRNDCAEMEPPLPRKLSPGHRAKDHTASRWQREHADRQTLTNIQAGPPVFIVAMQLRCHPVHPSISMNSLPYRRFLSAAGLMLAPLAPGWSQQPYQSPPAD